MRPIAASRDRLRWLPIMLLLACNPTLPQGQFGPYSRTVMHLVLGPAETLTVYRVKYWTSNDGSAPALQLEYEAPFPVSDTAAVRREAIHLWPMFAPYVRGMGLSAGIITATNLRIRGLWPIAWSSQTHHFGFVVEEGSIGHWHFQHDTAQLPPPDTSGIERIIDAHGKPLPHHLPVPKVAP